MRGAVWLALLAGCGEEPADTAQACGDGVAVVHLAVDAVSGATVKTDSLRYSLDGAALDAECSNMPCNEAELPLGDLSSVAGTEVSLALEAVWHEVVYTETCPILVPAQDPCGRVSLELSYTFTLDDSASP
ncbi:MAG: hypothetical protein JXX28_08080 [Deltaproteobacteria bacterium]|nr:hypothetical protein [Deltaproteobacteria bacterium]